MKQDLIKPHHRKVYTDLEHFRQQLGYEKSAAIVLSKKFYDSGINRII